VRADDRASSALTLPPPGRLAPFEPRTQPSNSPQAPPEQPGPDIETWVQPTKLGKRQSWRGVAVPQATPQARRAQNGMPVELFANNSSRGPTGRSRTLCRLPSSARLYDWSATKPQPLLRGSISPIRTLVLPQRVQVPHGCKSHTVFCSLLSQLLCHWCLRTRQISPGFMASDLS
jgi:hypothetical protein